MKIPRSVKITLWVNRVIALFLLLIVWKLPTLLDWSMTLGHIGTRSARAIGIAFYCCAPVVALALWNLDALLRSILAARVFVGANVRAMRRVRWCCLGVCLICLPAAFFYPPLVFMVVIMAFLALVVSVLAAVMDAAVAIREENDLTI